MQQLDEYEGAILSGWEDVHNKSQLSLWLLVTLKDGPKYKDTIKAFIDERTNGQIQPDDKSIYRALRRFNDSELVHFQMQPSPGGPDLKVYELSKTGERVLQAFITRNISDIFYQPTNRMLLEKGTL